MTITRFVKHFSVTRQQWLAAVLMLSPLGLAFAWQSSTTPVKPSALPALAPSPSAQFQQTVQQQQVRDQVQKSQLQQRLRQHVSDTTKRPFANDLKAQQQLDQASHAQQDRNRASQQDLLNRYQNAPVLPRVLPKSLPAPALDGD